VREFVNITEREIQEPCFDYCMTFAIQ